MPTAPSSPVGWAATVRRLEDGFFVPPVDGELPARMGADFSMRSVECMPCTTQFFRLAVELLHDAQPCEIWVVFTAPSTGRRKTPAERTPLDDAKLFQARTALEAALPEAILCFTTEDHEGCSRLVGAHDRAPAIAAAVAVVKHYAAWDESDPIVVHIAEEQFAVSVGLSGNAYHVTGVRGPSG